MTFDPLTPYDDLPPLPPAREMETRAVLKKCLSATRALAELKGAGDLIPNQAILINSIPLQEAKLSSEIENIVTTEDALFRAQLDETLASDPATKEVIRYRKALRYGYEALRDRPLDLDIVRGICATLRNEPISLRSEENVYIGNRAAGTITYTPPHGSDVIHAKMANLIAFLNGHDQLDPLVRMAVGHYQFEAIHPFIDGNGRTGRILNILMLIQRDLLRIPVLYLSHHIIENKPDYYRLLRGVTERQEWEEWVLFMLAGVELTAIKTGRRIRAIRELMDRTLDQCRLGLPTRVYSKELVETLFTQPYCRSSVLVEAGIAKRQTASLYLRELEKIGILTSEGRGPSLIFRNNALIELLSSPTVEIPPKFRQ